MVETDIIEVKNGAALGIRVKLPKEDLLLIRAEKGFLCCGYFDKKTLEKIGSPAVMITGVKSFKDMLRKKASFVSKQAKKLGININMTGRQALEKMV